MAFGFCLVGPGDEHPAAGAAAGGRFAGLDAVVDDAVAAAETCCGVGDADLAVSVGVGGGDVVGVADPLHGLDVERRSGAGGVPGGVEPFGQFGGRGGGSQADHHVDGGRRAAFGGAGVGSTRDGDVVGGAGVPADPDPHLADVGFGEQGDVGDEGAQQPFTVLVAGGGTVPECGQ